VQSSGIYTFAAAGTVTFNLNCYRTDTITGSVSMSARTLRAVYVPTQY